MLYIVSFDEIEFGGVALGAKGRKWVRAKLVQSDNFHSFGMILLWEAVQQISLHHSLTYSQLPIYFHNIVRYFRAFGLWWKWMPQLVENIPSSCCQSFSDVFTLWLLDGSMVVCAALWLSKNYNENLSKINTVGSNASIQFHFEVI